MPVRKGRKTACLSRKEGRKVGVPAREWRKVMAWCLAREGKLACQGKESFRCLPGKRGRFYHWRSRQERKEDRVPISKGMNTACLSGKEGRQRARQERKEDSVCLSGKEGRQRACQ
jgi:hypothetical protein